MIDRDHADIDQNDENQSNDHTLRNDLSGVFHLSCYIPNTIEAGMGEDNEH